MERTTRDDTRFGPKRDIFNRDDDRRSSPYRNKAEPRRNFFSRDDDRRSSPNRNETETRREFFRRDDGGRPSRQETTETVSLLDVQLYKHACTVKTRKWEGNISSIWTIQAFTCEEG